ncbi:MAG: hypothetical protein RLZZ383_1038 [Pseudomonadota bacterium]
MRVTWLGVVGMAAACGGVGEPDAAGVGGAPDAAASATSAAPTAARAPSLMAPGPRGTTPLPAPTLTAQGCANLSTGGPLGPDGSAGVLGCGSRVTGHTAGGGKRFDTKFYERNQCAPATRNWDGGDERVYRLALPEGEAHAVVTLDSPCADLSLAAFPWTGAGLPSGAETVDRCELNKVDGPKREFVEIVSQGTAAWLVVVEGIGTDEGAFAISVDCYAGLAGYAAPIGAAP